MLKWDRKFFVFLYISMLLSLNAVPRILVAKISLVPLLLARIFIVSQFQTRLLLYFFQDTNKKKSLFKKMTKKE